MPIVAVVLGLWAMMVMGAFGGGIPPSGVGAQWKVRFPDVIGDSVVERKDESRNPIRLIDWREWRQMSHSSDSDGPMLIVDTKAEVESEVPEALEIEETIPTSPEPSTTTPASTTTTAPTTTSVAENSTTSDSSTTAKSMPDVTLELKNLPDMMTLLKHLAMIPAVVRSFSSAALPSGSSAYGPQLIGGAASGPLRSRALSSNSGYSGFGGDASPSNANYPQFVTVAASQSEIPQIAARRDPMPNMPAPIIPVNSEGMRPREVTGRPTRLNIYGLESRAVSPSQPYVAPMPATSTESPRRLKPRFDLSNLTIGEVEQLESIHRKLFQPSAVATVATTTRRPSPIPLTESPLFVYNKPPETDNAESAHNPTLPPDFDPTALKPEMLNELMMVKDLPDLEELTKGMDLSLLSRPGGFAVLKQQFMERLIERSVLQRRRLRSRQ